MSSYKLIVIYNFCMSVGQTLGTSIAENAYVFSLVLSENHDKAVFMQAYGCQGALRRQLFGICCHAEYIYHFDWWFHFLGEYLI